MLLNVFFLSLIGFATLYILRGIGLITFLAGGVIMALLMTAVISGLTWSILKNEKILS